MQTSLVLTIIGDDRPGLVGTLSRVVADHGGSWQESQMARLAGKFAGILRAEVPQEQAAALQRALDELSADGLQVVVESSADSDPNSTVDVTIELVGSDRPGIVRELSQALVDQRVNIEEIRTGTSEAPMSGGRLFTANLRIRLPVGVSTQQLQKSLEGLANEIMVDIALDEQPTTAASPT